MNTLLHICCAPCANQCIDVLRTDGCAVTGYWYNPNIHPFTEYRSRRNCLRDYAASIGLPLIERNDYGLRPFVRAVAEDIDGRCVKCYSIPRFPPAVSRRAGACAGAWHVHSEILRLRLLRGGALSQGEENSAVNGCHGGKHFMHRQIRSRTAR